MTAKLTSLSNNFHPPLLCFLFLSLPLTHRVFPRLDKAAFVLFAKASPPHFACCCCRPRTHRVPASFLPPPLPPPPNQTIGDCFIVPLPFWPQLTRLEHDAALVLLYGPQLHAAPPQRLHEPARHRLHSTQHTLLHDERPVELSSAGLGPSERSCLGRFEVGADGT